MKHIFCLVTGLFMASIYAHANPVNGIYLNADKDRCIVICDSLVYICRPGKPHLYDQVTYAECKIEEESKPFIKIKSVKNPVITAFQNMKVVQSSSGQIDGEDLEIKISFPEYHHRLRINVYTNKAQMFTYDYYSNEVIKLPKDGNSTISIEIYNPLDFIIFPKELFGGIPYYASAAISIENETTSLSITLPDINEGLFPQRYIQGEYIKYSDNYLEWRDERFFRKMD